MTLPINLWLIHPETEMCDAFHGRFAHLPNVRVVQRYFEELDPHDCFVTAANSFGIMNAGIDAAVVRFHGAELMQRIQSRIMDEYLGEQPIGTCIIEPTENPSYPFIAHTPTMRIPGSITGTDKVYAATRAALIAIYRHNIGGGSEIKTVAMPAMGAGFGAVPYDEVARQMAVAYEHYLHPPHQLDWESVAIWSKSITHDGDKRVVN